MTIFSLLLLLSVLPFSLSKTTIEPCSVSDSCPALLGYTLYTDLKVSEIAALFRTDPYSILATNAFDLTVPDAAHRILPAGLFIRIPTVCACSDGIRKSVSTRYTTHPTDTLASIASNIFSGLASADQIRQANAITDPSALDVGQTLVIPLPCVCFNSTDNFLPAVYLSYVIKDGESVQEIAAAYSTTVTDIMNVNAMGNPTVHPGDILAIPLPACPSIFPKFASDHGMLVANSTYTITAGNCVQCSCGPGNLNLYCTPSSMAVSCSNMQCRNSNLMLGNVTAKPTSAGCNVTSCNYGGFVNGTIVTTLSTSLQPKCPGVHQFPAVIEPPTVVLDETSNSSPAPSPISPAEPGGVIPAPRSSLPGKGLAFPGATKATGPTAPAGSTSGAPSFTRLNPLLVQIFNYCVLVKFLL
ncbi:lysM domain-containing GPI-anchored protein 1-like protein [Carex littledalei]|uniref:LysM domain-containing GPI-anchored protein 1-like protein n=1 Tax=Carex littledalei TaxID=544730 RepID=A0A833QHX2_9POAL|nr:lysM domain-containing GPI-anchored protein 1-like protein [Carex littledalei]